MDLIWSLALIVGILLALNHMAGGKPNAVLRPVFRILNSIFNLVLKLVISVGSRLINLAGNSIKSKNIRGVKDDRDRPKGPTPPRW